jgi:hypothetical protein
MAYSQGAQKTDILKEVSFWVISSYTGAKTSAPVKGLIRVTPNIRIMLSIWDTAVYESILEFVLLIFLSYRNITIAGEALLWTYGFQQ